MSENKFTPGPWETRKVTSGLFQIFEQGAAPNRIAIAVLSHESDHSDELREIITPANAKLIAAAPELLQALIEAREMLITKGMKEDSVGLIGINNVIKKATTVDQK